MTVVDFAAPAAPPTSTHLPPQLMPWLERMSILTKDLRTVKLGTVMNYAQRDFVNECQKQLDATGHIRQCVLKARQLGISTIIEGILFILAIHTDDMNCLIVSHEAKSAQGILKMTKRYWRTYPFRRFHAEEYAGKNQLSWTHGSNIEVATAKNEAGGRSSTIQCLHASEVAFWDDPATLMLGLRQTIPSFGLTAIFIESTANGIGNYYHQTCTEARKGSSEYNFCFYPWWRHPEYNAAFVPPEERDKYMIDMGALDKEEQSLVRRFNLDSGRILWRRYAIQNLCQGDLDKFHQEYPSDPDEAFISTGRNAFPLPLIIEHAHLETGIRSRLIRDKRGAIRPIADGDGSLTMFRPPSADKQWGIYLIGGDPTHTTSGDYACAQVINRRTLEQVAVYRRKTDPITFGKDIELVARYYNDAFIAPEREGPGYATVGALVAGGYPHVYQTQNVAKTPGKPADSYGWSTNVATKHLAISHLLRAIKDPLSDVGSITYGLVIHDEMTAAEMRDYVHTEDGRGYTNSDGSMHDDGVMALAIALTVHNIEPPVDAYTPRETRSNLPRNVQHQDAPVATPNPTGGAYTPTEPPSDDDFDTDEKQAPWETWGRKDS